MILSLLRENGIEASAPGNAHSGLLGGMAASALSVPIHVADEDAERARELVAAYFDAPTDGEVDEREELEEDRGEQTPTSSSGKKKSVAIAAAIVFPGMCGLFGAGHFYAGRMPVGFALLALGLGSAIAAFMVEPMFAIGSAVAIIADVIGATRAV